MNGGKNLLLLEEERVERGGGRLCVLPESLFLAASPPLSVYFPCMGKLNIAAQRQNRGADTKIETNLWPGSAETAEGAASRQSEIDGENWKQN